MSFDGKKVLLKEKRASLELNKNKIYWQRWNKEQPSGNKAETDLPFATMWKQDTTTLID